MHLFTGHGKEGSWMWQDEKGVHHVMTPAEVRSDMSIIWIRVDGSGEFHWPHKQVYHDGRDPVAMDYDERQS
jgi:hypothetical protein